MKLPCVALGLSLRYTVQNPRELKLVHYRFLVQFDRFCIQR